MWYPLALFVHITGAVLLFVALGLEWLGLNRLRQAQRVEQAREAMALLRILEKLFPVSTVLILGGGLYMAITAWGFALAWLDAALIAVVAMTIGGNVLSAPRLAAIGRTAFTASVGPLSASLRARTMDPKLVVWSRLSAILGWWIVFLMTLKPGLPGTIVSLVVAGVLAGALAQIAQRARRRYSMDELRTQDRDEVAVPSRQ